MVARLAAPAIAQQLLYTLVFLVDRAMLGHHGAASLASMQISKRRSLSVMQKRLSHTSKTMPMKRSFCICPTPQCIFLCIPVLNFGANRNTAFSATGFRKSTGPSGRCWTPFVTTN